MQSISGKELKQIRIAENISLEEISHYTHISIESLIALENDNTSVFNSLTQFKGFLNIYSKYLRVGDHLKIIQTAEQTANSKIDDKDLKKKPYIDLDETKDPLLRQEIRNEPISQASEILLKIGDNLKDRRLSLNLSLESIEEFIHVKKEYLQMLEEGRIFEFNSTVQSRGYLLIYAKFLNFSEENILKQFAEALQIRRVETIQNDSRSKSESYKKISPLLLTFKKFITIDLFWGIFFIVFLFIFIIWGASTVVKEFQSMPINTALPEIVDVIIQTPTQLDQEVNYTPVVEVTESTIDIIQSGPTLLFTPVSVQNPLQMVIIANNDAWARITLDGKKEFEGRLKPGNVYQFSAKVNIEILTGNAAGLQIIFNEMDVGSLGVTGQVRYLFFDKNGLAKPTPSVTPSLVVNPNLDPTITNSIDD